MSDKIAVIKYHPLQSIEVLQATFESEHVEAIILESFGAGNLPTNRPQLYKLISNAGKRGVIIVNLSQCYQYRIKAIYETGKLLSDLGVVQGGDLTVEGCLAKLAYLLGKKLPTEEIKSLLQKNLRGEITPAKSETQFQAKQQNFLKKVTDAILNNNSFASEEKEEFLRELILPNIVCYMAKYGYIEFLSELKNYDTNFNGEDYDKRTPLHIAAKEGNLQVIKFLLQEETDTNAIDIFGRTPLFEAVVQRHKDIIYELRQAGGIVKAPEQEITHMLLMCGKDNDFNMVDMFYEAGLKNFNEHVNEDLRNIAHIAVQYNSIELISYLKNKTHFDFYRKDKWGKTPYDEALEQNRKMIMKIITKR